MKITKNKREKMRKRHTRRERETKRQLRRDEEKIEIGKETERKCVCVC